MKQPAVLKRKYTATNLLPALRLAAKLRKRMLSVGLTDNGGAIHSAERIVDILGLHINYKQLTHRNNLRMFASAEISFDASRDLAVGKKILIEHVAPLRALTQVLLELIDTGKSDASVLKYLRRHYRLVLLSVEETQRLNRLNRSKIEHGRLEKAGIKLSRAKLKGPILLK